MKQVRYEKRVPFECRREFRKEKSREAARCRRGKEGEVFADLTNCLPMPDLAKSALDKTTIVRLTINYMRTRDLLQSMLISTGESYLYTKELLNAMHGFVLLLSVTGEVMYVTTNVREALGLSQVDMIGNKLSDFIHPCDVKDFTSNLKLKSNRLSFLLRVKSTLLPKGRVVNLKSATYKAVKFDGHAIRSAKDVKSKRLDGAQECILLTGHPLASSVEADNLDSMSFTSSHNLDMMFTRCDNNVSVLLGYCEDVIIGTSFYDLVYPADIDMINDSFKALFSKGQTITDPYRFMAHGGGFARVVTEATVVYNSKTTEPQSVVCVHKVISEPEDIGSLIAAVRMVKCEPTAACQAECRDVFADTESLFAGKELQMSAAQYRVQTADAFDTPSFLCSDVDGVASILEATASLFDADYGSTDDVENEERGDEFVNRAKCRDVFADAESLFAGKELQMSAAQYRVQTADAVDTQSFLSSDVDGVANILEATASLFDADYGSTDDVKNEERDDEFVNWAESRDVFADTESLFAGKELQMSAAQYRVQTADAFDTPSFLSSDVDGDANILEATASLFDADYGSTDDVKNEERGDEFVNWEPEMLVDKLDNDVLDVNIGLMVDMQDLCDEGFDLFMRAPYIPMTTQENLDLMNDFFNSSSADSSGSASSGTCDLLDSVGYKLRDALIVDLARNPCYASSASSPTSASCNEDYLSLFGDIQYSMSPINSMYSKRSASDEQVSEESAVGQETRKERDNRADSQSQVAPQAGLELSTDSGGYWKPSITTACAYNRTVSGKQHLYDKQEGEEQSWMSLNRLSHRAAGGELSYVKGSGHPNLSAKGPSSRSHVNHSAGSVQNHALNQACSLVGLKRGVQALPEDRRGYPPHKCIAYDVLGDPPFGRLKQEDEEPIECSHMLKRIKLSCDRNAHADLLIQSGLKILRQMLLQDLGGEDTCSQ